MEENMNELTEVVADQVSTDISTKLTTVDKLKIGGGIALIATTGWVVGEKAIKPALRWLMSKIGKVKVKKAKKPEKKQEPAAEVDMNTIDQDLNIDDTKD